MTGMLADFHFLRPWFLAATLLAVPLYFWLKKLAAPGNNWAPVIDRHLLPYLLSQDGETPETSRPFTAAVITGWLLACLALAGPSWEKETQAVSRIDNALIIVLDLSLSMYAEDEEPSRLVRAKRKISDILKQRREGETSLIVYSGDAHTVVPLTGDNKTIANMLPSLEPGIMPQYGSNIADAMALVKKHIDKSHSRNIHVLLLTDELAVDDLEQSMDNIAKADSLSIITFGTEQGAPIPLQSGFLRDNRDNTVIARLNLQEIRDFAAGRAVSVSHNRLDNHDIRPFIESNGRLLQNDKDNRKTTLWLDSGYWLLLPLLLLMPAAFRRGWLLVFCLAVVPDQSYALEWQDLWQNRDQQASKAFDKGEHKKAADLFENPDWKAASLYRNGDYEKALQYFSDNSADGLYNKGNALAQLGRYEQAIASYDKALARQKDHQDAAANKALLQKLLEEKEQQQQQQDGDSKQDESQAQEGQDNRQDQQGQSSQESSTGEQSSQQQHSNGQQYNNPDGEPNNSQKNNDSQADGAADKDKTDQQHNNAQQMDDTAQQPEQQSQARDSRLSPDEELDARQQQALQQWLRSIPDEPGQLLKNKFRYEHEQNRRQNNLIDKESEQVW